MQINYIENGNTVEVKLAGELDTPATIQIQPTIDQIAELASKNIVVDCSGLSYIASSGLRQLITIHKACKALGGHLKLSAVPADVLEIFQVTNFDKVFDID